MSCRKDGLLIELARSLNEYVQPVIPEDRLPPVGGNPGGKRPGDDFNERHTWEEILLPEGWAKAGAHGGLDYWRRPGKPPPGASATTGVRPDCGKDLLYVFSTNARPFEPDKSYSKFGAWGLLKFRGDFQAAAAELRRRGYGDPELPSGRISFGTNGNGKPAGPENQKPSPFPLPVPMSELKRCASGNWLWYGYLNRGGITLLSALWKAGKTTFLTGLLKGMEAGGQFCGLDISAGRVLYVAEESENRWAERRDLRSLTGQVDFLIRPYNARPDWGRWNDFVGYLGEQAKKLQTDLLLIDSISRFWPVRDENDASQVTSAIMPFQGLPPELSVGLVHHNRKGDGQEATAARGSGALTAVVDTIMELRRYAPADRQDRRRVITSYGRWDETPDELVIELGDNGEYVVHGTKRETGRMDALTVIGRLLPTAPPGLTRKELLERWPHDTAPRTQTVVDALRQGVESGIWHEEGNGKKGSPNTFWRSV